MESNGNPWKRHLFNRLVLVLKEGDTKPYSSFLMSVCFSTLIMFAEQNFLLPPCPGLV